MLGIQVQGLQNIWDKDAKMTFYVNEKMIRDGCYISTRAIEKAGQSEMTSYIAVNIVSERNKYGVTYVLLKNKDITHIEMVLLIEKVMDLYTKNTLEVFEKQLNNLAIEIIGTPFARTEAEKQTILDYVINPFNSLKVKVIPPTTQEAADTTVSIWGPAVQQQFRNAHNELWVVEEVGNQLRFSGQELGGNINVMVEDIDQQIADIQRHLSLQTKTHYALKNTKGEMLCLEEEEIYWLLAIFKSAHNALKLTKPVL